MTLQRQTPRLRFNISATSEADNVTHNTMAANGEITRTHDGMKRNMRSCVGNRPLLAVPRKRWPQRTRAFLSLHYIPTLLSLFVHFFSFCLVACTTTPDRLCVRRLA